MDTATKINPFEPTALKSMPLKNRLVMAPMTRSRAIDALPNELMATYYGQRASAGLIITEGIAPSPNGLGYARIPGIFDKEQVTGWKKVTEAVHHRGGKIIAQLMHTGRVAHAANLPKGAKILAPSAISVEGQIWTDSQGMQPYPVPEAMTAEEIKTAVQEFAQAAKNAVEAGFDGVELHGANGYLLEQYLNPHINTRTDGYGGTVPNRIRFVLETVDAVIAAVGEEKVGIRLSPYNTFNSMPVYPEIRETYETLVAELNNRELLYIHIVESSARTQAEGQELLKAIRKGFEGALIANGAYTKGTIESALEEQKADLIALGVPYIANPDLAARLQKDLPLNAPHPESFYSADEKGYTDYPFYEN